MGSGSKRTTNKPRISVGELQEQVGSEVIDGAPEPFGPNNPVSRAVARLVVPGETAVCPVCDERVKFSAREKLHKVVATVVNSAGIGVETITYFPLGCYTEDGAQFGPVFTLSSQDGIDAGLIESKVNVA